MNYFPHTPADISAMLKTIGVDRIEDLFAEIPESLKLAHELNIPTAKSETEVRQIIGGMAADNARLTCFAGGGAYDHYTPAIIPYIASRSEFSTSYTPYQAEISQGTMQYIFEYQTMMSRLTGLDVSNASMYDGATATAEAMMMTVAAAKKRNRVVVSATLLPAVLNVIKTYAKFHGIELIVVPATAAGQSDLQAIGTLTDEGQVAGVVVPQVNRYGIVEDLTGLADRLHAQKTLLAVYGTASMLGVLKSPAEWGADIACGEAQSLGIPLSFGGPYIGYLCTTNALIRKMPGRLVGQTLDARGNRCFVLTMQAREQHIRREKATSNICTAQGVMCLYVAMYLSLMGDEGLKKVNEISAAGAAVLRRGLTALPCFTEAFPGAPTLCEFTLRYSGAKPLSEVHKALADRGYLAGIIDADDPSLITFAVTECRTKDEVDGLVEAFAQLTA
ncbi:MAG: aminomethyl-transferring glycine dehydrogenase subunit GcvPA [Alloprevotella sp.]|nr:aminomethyl-transferring glycine dehydrogenase subunit GcvPA [Alloprevotella sp.]